MFIFIDANSFRMTEIIRENCGIVLSYSLADAYNEIKLLQHRGQEAAGIEGFNGNGIDSVKWAGSVDAFSLDNLDKLLPGRDYKIYAAHVRYATKGRKDRLLQDAHPHTIGGDRIDRGNHIITRRAKKSIIHNGQIDPHFLKKVNKSLLKSDCDSEALLHKYDSDGIKDIIRTIPGTYSAIIFDSEKGEALAFRDSHEIRPLCMGIKDGKYIFASETRPLERHGGRYLRDVYGGEVIYLDFDGKISKSVQYAAADPRHCFFELTYLHHYDSHVGGKRISETRRNLGIAAAKEFHPSGIQIISYVPKAPEYAAMGYAEAYAKIYGLNFDNIFRHVYYKMSDTRTFIQSYQDQREEHIGKNLFVFDNIEVKDKVVLVIDDSIIRGTESRRAVELLREKGPAAIYFVSYTPPVGIISGKINYGCEQGVDMPPNPEVLLESYTYIIRKGGSIDGVRAEIGADKLYYLSRKGMLSALGMDKSACHRCIGGPRVYSI